MDKLEWCRNNAPDILKEATDEELLEKLGSSYDKYFSMPEPVLEKNTINDHMDSMVLDLVSEFGDQLAFKGGYMLTKLMPEFARQTTDIDFSIQNSELYTDLKKAMVSIGESFVADGKITTYKVKESISPTSSGGIDMYNNKGTKILGIDIGWHDLTFGTHRVNIDLCELRAFEIERMLADKISAILSRKRFRRPKDIYDLYCITNCFNFDIKTLDEFIIKRTNGVGADWQNYPFNKQILIEYEKAYNSLTLHSIVKGKDLKKPTFVEVMQRFAFVCRELRDLREESDVYWDHKVLLFRKYSKRNQ